MNNIILIQGNGADDKFVSTYLSDMNVMTISEYMQSSGRMRISMIVMIGINKDSEENRRIVSLIHGGVPSIILGQAAIQEYSSQIGITNNIVELSKSETHPSPNMIHFMTGSKDELPITPAVNTQNSPTHTLSRIHAFHRGAALPIVNSYYHSKYLGKNREIEKVGCYLKRNNKMTSLMYMDETEPALLETIQTLIQNLTKDEI